MKHFSALRRVVGGVLFSLFAAGSMAVLAGCDRKPTDPPRPSQPEPSPPRPQTTTPGTPDPAAPASPPPSAPASQR